MMRSEGSETLFGQHHILRACFLCKPSRSGGSVTEALRLHLAIYYAGPNLLRLPVEVLERISEFFSHKEWAEGPSQACSYLYYLCSLRIAMEPSTSPLNPLTVSLPFLSCL